MDEKTMSLANSFTGVLRVVDLLIENRSIVWRKRRFEATRFGLTLVLYIVESIAADASEGRDCIFGGSRKGGFVRRYGYR
jgi:hypothetical protein